MVKLKSINGLVAINIILMAWSILFLVLLKGLGGEQAIFLIIGYIGGWMSSLVYFFFRKPPTEAGK